MASKITVDLESEWLVVAFIILVFGVAVAVWGLVCHFRCGSDRSCSQCRGSSFCAGCCGLAAATNPDSHQGSSL